MNRAPRWKRVLFTLLAYFGLLALWPVVRPLYAPVFRSVAQFLVAFANPLSADIEVYFDPGSGGIESGNVHWMDTVVRLHHKRFSGNDSTTGASSFFHGYHPTAVLLALFIGATPLAWRARRRPLAWAGGGLCLFIGLRCLISVYYMMSRAVVDGKPALDLAYTTTRVLFWSWHFFWIEPATTYVVPFVLWALCVFTPRTRDAVVAG